MLLSDNWEKNHVGWKNNMKRTKYLAVFATTTLIFIIGIIIGYMITLSKLNTISNMEQDLKINAMDIELQYLLLAEDPCTAINSTFLTDELFQIGIRLDFMERDLGIDNPSVIALKEYYSLLELRHWIFTKKKKKECNINKDLVLYFYSNKGDCPKCEEQGFILNYMHKKYPKLSIYSFDINMKNNALSTVKKIYGVKKRPSIIINNKLYSGFKSKKEIESALGYG